MIEAECPDQVYIQFGLKWRVRNITVCLPNRVYVVVEGKEHSSYKNN
ncbi:NusG domain II-containing protein [Alkaliphilus sp. B6464]|nr:NusG domain II-containing protein [Alkaliphilus sp. B6464]QUH21024.1 NusG domain II-containing protein [Alkaliphilus sp. B6464]